MTVSMTIENADDSLLNAIKSVIKLSPQSRVKIQKKDEFVDQLLAERAEIKQQFAIGNLRTYASMAEYRAAHGGV